MRWLIILCLLGTFVCRSQRLYDTLYYTKCYDKTLWSLFQNTFSHALTLNQRYTKDSIVSSALSMQAESFVEFGISYANSKQFVAINLFTTPNVQSTRKPKPNYVNVYVSDSDRDHLYEVGFNWNRSYYDGNSANFVADFSGSKPYHYYQRFRTLNTYFNYIHFTNYKRFSYNAAYRGTARQKKSASTAMFSGGIHYTRAESDTAFIPYQVRGSYGDYSQLCKLFQLHISGGVGASGTLVLFRSLFVNAFAMVGPVVQIKQYDLFNTSGLNTRVGVNFFADGRCAIGLNLKNFMISNVTLINYRGTSLGRLDIGSTYISNSFSVGYRFKTRSRRINY